MTTGEATGHVVAGTVSGGLLLAGGWWMVLGIVGLIAWALLPLKLKASSK